MSTKPDERQKRQPTPAQALHQNKWGRAEPGSVLAGMDKEQKRAFQAWLKERDKDLSEMLYWARRNASSGGKRPE